MTGSKERLEAFLSKPLVAVYYFDQETVFYDGWYMALYQIATDNTRYKRLFRDLEQADGEMALKRKSIYALESTEKDGLSFSAIVAIFSCLILIKSFNSSLVSDDISLI